MSNLLKGLWREVRPNAVWDLIKYMVLLAISGLAVSGYKYLAYLREIPTDRVIDVAIFAGSFVLLLGAVALTRYRDARMLEAPLRVVSEIHENASRALSEYEKREKGETRVEPPAERIVVDVPLEHLASFFDELTGIQASKLVEPYIGRWIQVSGLVDQITSYTGHAEVRLMTAPPREMAVYASFQDAKWIDRLRLLRRKDPLTVFGQIEYVSAVASQLKFCELVPTKPPA
jgi:hypothetical protein